VAGWWDASVNSRKREPFGIGRYRSRGIARSLSRVGDAKDAFAAFLEHYGGGNTRLVLASDVFSLLRLAASARAGAALANLFLRGDLPGRRWMGCCS